MVLASSYKASSGLTRYIHQQKRRVRLQGFLHLGCVWFRSQGGMQRIRSAPGPHPFVWYRSGEPEPTHSPEWNIQPRCGVLVPLIWRNHTEHLSALTSTATHLYRDSLAPKPIPGHHRHSLVSLPLDLRLHRPLPHISLSGAASPSPPRRLSLSLDLWRRHTKDRRWWWGRQGEQGRRSSSCVETPGLASNSGGRGAVAEAHRTAAAISSCCSARRASCGEYLSTLHAYGHCGPELVLTGPSTSRRQPSGAHSTCRPKVKMPCCPVLVFYV